MLRAKSLALSPAQRIALELAARAQSGVLERVGPRSFGNKSWERMMGRLCARGLMKPYVHGGYEITPAGRSLLAYDAWPAQRFEKRSSVDR
jgi:hypothetical protein